VQFEQWQGGTTIVSFDELTVSHKEACRIFKQSSKPSSPQFEFLQVCIKEAMVERRQACHYDHEIHVCHSHGIPFVEKKILEMIGNTVYSCFFV
jgi:hypothetical protein